MLSKQTKTCMLTPVNFANKKVITVAGRGQQFSLSPQTSFLEYRNAPGATACADILNTCSTKSFFLCKYPSDKLNVLIIIITTTTTE